jgi:hypothetical protein
MSTFDPMAAGLDWLDAYRAASLTIVGMYSKNAFLECGCGGQTVLIGHTAIAEYWYQRFTEKPMLELVDLQPQGEGVAVSYRVPRGIVNALLSFDENGKIKHCNCGPLNDASAL